MELSYEGIGQVVATFAMEEGVEPGMAVALVDNGTVGMCGSGVDLCGKVLAVHGGCCAVQMSGFVKLPFTGESPTTGWNSVAGDGSGGVCVGQGSNNYLIVQVDDDECTIVFKM